MKLIHQSAPFIPNSIQRRYGGSWNTDYVLVNGINAATATTEETIGSLSAVYSAPAAAQALTISSSSVADVMTSGTGAWTVEVVYLDSNYNQVTAILEMNGQTGVAVGTGIRVNHISVLTAGTGGVNAGIIYVGYGTITTGVPASIVSRVEIGVCEDQQAFYTVPNGKTGFIEHIDLGVSVIGRGFLYTREFGGVFTQKATYVQSAGGRSIPLPVAFKVGGKGDIEFRAITTAAGVVSVSAYVSLGG